MDPGEPIKELAGWEQPTSDKFLRLVRGRIQRRSTVGQFATFSWDVPRMILGDFWITLLQALNPQDRKKKEEL